MENGRPNGGNELILYQKMLIQHMMILVDIKGLCRCIPTYLSFRPLLVTVS
jgi:hypothetical protein